MSRSHKKKRNTGLLYEFLIKKISSSLVEGDQRGSSQALKILKKHFKPGTALYKEFRIINSLRKTTVSSETVAANILQEAKVAVRGHDLKELDKQKSLLIRDINYALKDENFYDQQVEEYKFLATVQTLINDWRNPEDLYRIATFEDSVVKYLISEKKSEEDRQQPQESPGEGRLLMKVMMKKLNEKYSGALSNDQKSLIRAYAFSTANNNPQSIQLKLVEIKNKLLETIQKFETNNQSNDYVINKLNKTRDQLISEKLDNVGDELVTRFMLYTKLSDELELEEDQNV